MSILAANLEMYSMGKNVCGYLAKKGKSVRRQLAYYTVPVDIRVGIRQSKIKNPSFTCHEIYDRGDRYEHYLLRNGKIVKTVDYIDNKISKFNEYINNLSVVKSTKKVCKFCEEWFGGVEEPASNKRNLLSYDDIVKQRNSGSKPE